MAGNPARAGSLERGGWVWYNRGVGKTWAGVGMKEHQLEFEERFLSRYAQKSAETKGRLIEIEPCPYRTEYQRDRDRIVHCKAFRRLKHKTQVFLCPENDHFRTRLTHTLEVTQIARTIARALLLNEDLTEAIALGHDLGHTPFGHAGECVLNALTGHFRHNEQSLRVVDMLENDGKGLNLTCEVRDGILQHRSSGRPMTLEGKVVAHADRIAYINHDIDDAIRAGVIKDSDLPQDCVAFLGRTKGERINTLVRDMIESSWGKNEIGMSDEARECAEKLRGFMFERVYVTASSEKLRSQADRMLSMLFKHFLAHPNEVPRPDCVADPVAAICDYIASMSDNYAIRVAKDIFVPSGVLT